jgi:hypothetical protein
VTTRRKAPLPVIGWRELVTLPELSPDLVKVKVDTGARTSALHAFDMVIVDRDGLSWVDFEIHPTQRSPLGAVAVSCPIVEFRQIRSSTGHAERRPVIRTPLQIGATRFDIDLTLTSRDEMGFRMLLGRAAVRRRFLVDPGRSYVHSRARTRASSRPRDRGRPGRAEPSRGG